MGNSLELRKYGGFRIHAGLRAFKKKRSIGFSLCYGFSAQEPDLKYAVYVYDGKKCAHKLARGQSDLPGYDMNLWLGYQH